MTPDYLVCEYELPIPEEVAELMVTTIDWDEAEFHTYSFIGSPPLDFEKYTISSDGQLYKEIIKKEFARDDKGSIDIVESYDGIERQEHTGAVVFSILHLDKEYDFYLEFEGLFWKGDMKEIQLLEWEKADNKKRKEIQKDLEKLVTKTKKNEKSLLKKIKTPIHAILALIFGLIRYTLGFIVRITWKVQNFFS